MIGSSGPSQDDRTLYPKSARAVRFEACEDATRPQKMFDTVAVPLWALMFLVVFAAVTFASHFLFPSVRWFLRKRAERLVAQLNTRLKRPIQPFKLARRSDTINRLIHDPDVAQAIVEHARANDLREDVAYEMARRYAREIVPGFSAILYFGVATRLARWLSRSLYRVRVTGEAEAMARIDPEATLVYVLNHRSNMDYVLVTWLAARNTALAYAVGEWARRWPLGPLIRAMGGYFVRRKNRNPLYRRILARYVQLATENGVTQAFFPESRLSRDGALQKPKLGILSYIIADHDPDTDRDVVFVPVAINYERVLEDRVLIGSLPDTTHAYRLRWWMVLRYLGRHLQLRLTGRFSRFGYAAVSFGAPVSLNDFVGAAHPDPTTALATTLLDRIEDVLPVLPMALVCAAVLDGATSVSQVVARLDADMDAWRDGTHPLHRPHRSSRDIALTALRMLQIRRAIDLKADEIVLREDWRAVLRYYARTLPARPKGHKISK